MRAPYTAMRLVAVAGLACVLSTVASAQEAAPQDDRAQYSSLLANSFVTVNVGAIGYAFSDQQLAPGHSVGSIEAPHTAASVVLFGHHFGSHVSVQGSYMRPVEYVRYRDLDGTDMSQKVWMHFGTVTAQARLPVSRRLSIFGEGGLAITSRRGFALGGQPAVANAHFASPLFGGGIEYRLSPSLDLVIGTSVIPARSEDNNPATIFTAAGIRFNMRPVPPERVAEVVAAGYIFPRTIVQVGYATDAFGFSANHFFNKTVPIFWGGEVKVRRSGVNLQWERNVFHTKKLFSLDFGASYSQWQSLEANDRFHTLAVFPVLRFTVVRSRQTDLYVSFSEAGPAYISRVTIDGLPMGNHFTFQDFMAAGVFIGARKRLNIEFNLNHYSNGNLMYDNPGVTVPLAIKLGYAF